MAWRAPEKSLPFPIKNWATASVQPQPSDQIAAHRSAGRAGSAAAACVPVTAASQQRPVHTRSTQNHLRVTRSLACLLYPKAHPNPPVLLFVSSSPFSSSSSRRSSVVQAGGMEATTMAWTAAVVGAGLVYWFVWVMGAAEVKGKRAVDLKMGSITNDKVKDKYTQYWSFFRRPKETATTAASAEKVPAFVDTFYNLVTDIYEWGWGQSFHFSPSLPGRSHRDATRVHEERVADLLGAKPGHRLLDVGCGVGGPMRAIAAHSGSNVVGITINEYQVNRARAHNRKAGLDARCEVVCGNFLSMPFPDASFDGAYSIEATCHAPRLQDVYGEVFRVLKPGGLYVSYEWVTTSLYRAEDPDHVECIHGIERGDALPGLRRQDEIASIAKEVGFEVVKEQDLALPPALPWWTRLKMGRLAYWRNSLVVRVLTLLRIAPKGVAEVHEMLFDTAQHLTHGGETGIFTPMHMVLLRKPAAAAEEAK